MRISGWTLGVTIALVFGAAQAMPQDGMLGKKGGGKGSSAGGSSGSSGSLGPGKGSGSSGGGSQSSGGGLGKGGSSGPQGTSGGVQAPSRPRQGIPDASIVKQKAFDRRVEPPKPRSGQVNYSGTSNIVTGSNRPNVGIPSTLPSRVWSRDLGNQVIRETEVRIGDFRFRTGYYQYDRGWCDRDFRYPYYSFEWRPSGCVISPWYFYCTMPGYIIQPRVDFGLIGYTYDCVNPYYGWRERVVDYRWHDDDRYYDRNLNRALDDIQNLFEDCDYRVLNYLVPSRGRVGIYIDGAYRYSLGSDDFYDMMADLAYSTRTLRYSILDVRTGRGAARVLAAHEYLDPWGGRQTTYHFYTLADSRRGYEIVEFGTGGTRSCWPLR